MTDGGSVRRFFAIPLLIVRACSNSGEVLQMNAWC